MRATGVRLLGFRADTRGEERRMALAEELLSLASLAGQTVVAAAVTDAWGTAKQGFARLLGRSDPQRAGLAERRLELTREQLTGTPPAELEQVQTQLESIWRTRLLDLLEEHPDTEADLRALVEQIQSQLPVDAVYASGHGVAVGRDVNIYASDGGVAAGTIHGDVMPGNPTVPGPAEESAGPGARLNAASGSVVADRGGTAVGRVEYQRPGVASQPVRLTPRPVFLAGREELLADMDAQLTEAAAEGPRVVALCGLGGAGKTSVAVEYAHRHLARLRVVWQLAAEEPAALAAGFGDLAAQLGVREMLDAGNPVAQVHGALAARPGDWLLIFDNAPGPAAIQTVLPPAGHGQVVITSQDPHWPGGQTLDVPVLDQDVAAAFLQARTGSTDQVTALELADELGGLPLALEQASAYMQATGRSIAEYLAMFRQRSADLLARGEPAGYGKQVATTWRLAFEDLQRAAPHAVGLLRLLACCAPEQIPLRMLLQPLPAPSNALPAELATLLEDPLAADDAVAALRRFSLVSPPQGGSVSVRRLVQAVTLAQLPPEVAEAWRQAARRLIGAALPADPRRPGT